MKELGFARILRFTGKVLCAKIIRKNIPLVARWIITRRCNFKCVYCGISHVKKEELQFKEILGIIDKLYSWGTERISFTGGEPLLREDLGDIINYAKAKGIYTVINTNGKLLKSAIDKISNVSRITISLDGPGYIHDKLRCENSYDHVIEAIRLCQERNVRLVLTTVLCKNNLECIDFVLDIARKFNIKILFQPVSAYLLGENKQNPVVPDIQLYRNKILELIKRKSGKDRQFIYNSFSGLRHLYNWPNDASIPCWAARLHCTIDSDGDIYPCGHMLPVLKEVPLSYDNLKNGYNLHNNEFLNNCKQCWCASMVEFNLMLSLNMSSLWNIIRMEHLGFHNAVVMRCD